MLSTADEDWLVLKIDADGAEYELVPTLGLEALGVRVQGFADVGRRPVVKDTSVRG